MTYVLYFPESKELLHAVSEKGSEKEVSKQSLKIVGEGAVTIAR